MNEQRLSCLVVQMSVTKLRQNSVRKQDSTRLYQSWVQIIFNLILSFLILSYINTNRYLIPIDISIIKKVEFEMTYTNMRSLNIENEKPRLVMFVAGHLLDSRTQVVWDQYLQSFEFIQVTISVAIKGGKPQCLSLHKIVAQQPSMSGQTRADVVKTITTEFFLCWNYILLFLFW